MRSITTELQATSEEVLIPRRTANDMAPPQTVRRPNERIASIQAFRGIAALLVVFQHLYGLELKYFHTGFMGIFQFGWIGVDLFFVISGVVISLVTEGKFGKPRNAFVFIYRRFARIYPTFWFYFSIVLIAYLYNPLLVDASTGHHANLIRSFFLIPNQYGNLLYQAWTLSFELTFYLVFFIMMLLVRESWAPFVLVLWGVLNPTITHYFPVPHNSYILLSFTSPFIYEFLAGCLIFHLYRRFSFHPLFSKLLIVLAGLAFAALAIWTGYAHDFDCSWIKDSFWLRPGISSPIAGLMLLGAMMLERSGRLRIGRVFSALGDWSYSIYLSHAIVIQLVSHLIYRWVANLWYGILIIDAVALPVVIFVGYVSYTVIERPMMRLLYKGFRRRPLLEAVAGAR